MIAGFFFSHWRYILHKRREESFLSLKDTVNLH